MISVDAPKSRASRLTPTRLYSIFNVLLNNFTCRKFKDEIEKMKRLSYPGPDFEVSKVFKLFLRVCFIELLRKL